MKNTIMKKLFAFFTLIFVSYVSPSSDFSIHSTLSNLIENGGIFYTRTGALSLTGIVSSNVQLIEFSGTTLTGGIVYKTGSTLTKINSFYPLNTSLTGGTYSVSAFDLSGALL
jgi:hypothetical protein